MAINRISRTLPQRIAVDIIDNPLQFTTQEQRGLCQQLITVSRQLLIEPIARSTRAPKGTTEGLTLGHQVERPVDQVMVPIAAGSGLCRQSRLSGAQNRIVGLGHTLPLLIDPGEGIAPSSRLQVDQHPLRGGEGERPDWRGRVIEASCAVDQIGHILNHLLEPRISRQGIPPDLVGVGGEIDLTILLLIQRTTTLGVEILEHTPLLKLLRLFEELLISTNNLTILPQALAYPSTQLNDRLNPLCREKGMTCNRIRLLPDTIHTPSALNKPDNRPGQIVVHHLITILKILSLTEQIGRNQHIDRLPGQGLRCEPIRDRAKALHERCRILTLASHPLNPSDRGSTELLHQIVDRICKLGKDQHLFPLEALQQIDQRGQFAILSGIPATMPLEDRKERLTIGTEIRFELSLEEGRGDPAEAALQWACVGSVALCRTALVGLGTVGIGIAATLQRELSECILILKIKLNHVTLAIEITFHTEQIGALGAHRDRQTMVNRVDHDRIPQHMAI